MKGIVLECGDTVYLREPPPGALWLCRLPPLDLLPREQSSKFLWRCPSNWDEAKWLDYTIRRDRKISNEQAKQRGKLEDLACLLICGVQAKEETTVEALTYSRCPEPFQADIANLTLTDLKRIHSAVTPDLTAWQGFAESQEAEYAAVTAQFLGMSVAQIILGDPLEAALNIAITQAWIKKQNKPEEEK